MSVRTTKLINDPGNIVAEMLEGYAAAYPDIIRFEDGLIVRTTPKATGKVGLVIGNGSGHEPAMIGWVGRGLFDVNVPGQIFTAPGPSKLLTGIIAANRGAGVLVCVSNHAGDVLNAEMALEQATDAGIDDVDAVVLYDDVGSAPRGDESNRRGSAGLFFVWKIVGAHAEAGATLSDCKAMAERVRENTRTLSATLQSCAHPVSKVLLADIPDGEMVIGVGVHGESRGDVRPAPTANETIDIMLPQILDDLPYESDDEVCVLVNNAGALTVMELAILYRRAGQVLADRGIRVHRAWLGPYATTQDTAGFAISVCRVDADMKRLYDSPALGAGIQFATPVAAGEAP
ncbi:PTS-dependent dihydroxyacetone kinase, dihydroxyacetone-binding subunit DhaK [bacterium BMS3Abin02]|nr:PTS-dependent dihydroxyacetone kinase, dihydroxyacetone-binding subunit DhaK [bacterium BMS3Abin02]HDK45862.1 dihydroxyacetone kinase subunit DhaK [Actinomycetota bacterium]